MLNKLNLGCGNNTHEGYINLDFLEGPGVDRVHDLNTFPYPFEDNSFDEIRASHVLEHLTADWYLIMNELYRILKPTGHIKIMVPHFTNSSAYKPFHRKYFDSRSFNNTLGLDQIQVQKFKVAYRKLNFRKIPFIWNFAIEPIVNLHRYVLFIYENTILRTLFPAIELMVILTKGEIE